MEGSVSVDSSKTTNGCQQTELLRPDGEEKPLRCIGCEGIVTTRLLCPTCTKLGLPDSIFCSQDCFKTNWNAHRELHKAVRELVKRGAGGCLRGHGSLAAGVNPGDRATWNLDADLSRFDGFVFTGNLRPWPRTPTRTVPSHIRTPDYAVTGIPKEEQRTRGDSHRIVIRVDEEIQKLRTACHIGREALDLAHSMIRPGVTADAIDQAVHEFITIKHNCYPSPLNYNGFPKSCCISVNEAICHGIPDLRPLQDGDIVNVDVTVYKDGFHGDLNETFLCGTVDPESIALVKAAYDSLMAAVNQCRPGMMYREIGSIISKVVEERGFSVVRSYCGHGIGTLFHTAPSIPHYRKNKAIGVMKPGHVFTIEPMINAGHWKDTTWPDEWTSTTVDGRRSAQFEHTLLITDTGVDILTARRPTSPSLWKDGDTAEQPSVIRPPC